jgi:hypothetical protein
MFCLLGMAVSLDDEEVLSLVHPNDLHDSLIFMPTCLQQLIIVFAIDVVYLKSMKNKNESIPCYAPFLQFRSSIFEWRIDKDARILELDYDTYTLQDLVAYVHAHGFCAIDKECKFDEWFFAELKFERLASFTSLCNLLGVMDGLNLSFNMSSAKSNFWGDMHMSGYVTYMETVRHHYHFERNNIENLQQPSPCNCNSHHKNYQTFNKLF